MNKPSFLQWWREGLLLPFSASFGEVTVLDCQSGQVGVLASPGGALAPIGSQWSNLSPRRAYLYIDRDALITTTIPTEKRSLPLSDIASSLLPFEPDELLLGVDAQSSRIYAVLENEIAHKLAVLREHRVVLKGVAVSRDDEFDYIDVESLQGMIAAGTSKTWLLSGAAIVVALFVMAGLRWQAETDKQAEFQQAIEQFQRPNAGSRDNQLPNLGARSQRPGVAQSYSLLRAVLDALPAGAVVDQLILNHRELLLDMRASSASLVKAELDASKVFASSDFVSAISTDPGTGVERFRLQLSLADETMDNDQ